MNNNYMGKPIFPNNDIPDVKEENKINYNDIALAPQYMINILRMNKKRKVTIYTSFPKLSDNKDDKFNGILEFIGYDHLILSEPSSGKWKIIPTIYIDYISFDEPINYSSSI